MAKKINKMYIILGIIVLILTTLACGSVQVGMVTPTSEGNIQQAIDAKDQPKLRALYEQLANNAEQIYENENTILVADQEIAKIYAQLKRMEACQELRDQDLIRTLLADFTRINRIREECDAKRNLLDVQKQTLNDQLGLLKAQ